jgi:hypothetical protein
VFGECISGSEGVFEEGGSGADSRVWVRELKMPFSDIFEWSGWDDFEVKVFYDCELLRDVGSFKKGAKFSTVTWDEETLTLKFCLSGEEKPVMVKKLGLVD